MLKKWLISSLQTIGLALLAIVAFEFASYHLLPFRFTRFAPNYKLMSSSASSLNDQVEIRGYPRYYFQADPTLGFDISPNMKPMIYSFEDAKSEIFSNDFGCFDRNTLQDVKHGGKYVYFAGDSFTWGYSSYENKFPTVYERKSGRLSVKCGVTHTGTLHQFDKFEKVVREIGYYPDIVFVGYFDNDPTNDFSYPHSTVINGYLVDMIGWQDGELVRFDINNLKKAVEIVQNDSSEAAKDSGPVNLTGGWSFVLERYSLSYNMFISLGKALRARLFGKWENPSRGENVYCLQTLGKYNFKDMFFNNPYTRRNLEAISRWFDDSRKHNYRLVFILIPPDDYGDERYYSPLKAYLRDLGIEYVDLAHEFAVKQKAASKLYWPINRHLNEAGNYILGELLAERFR